MPKGEIKLEYESDLRSNEHNLSNSEKKAWKKKFRPVQDLNLWPLRYRCIALPTELNWELVTVLVPNKKKSNQTKTHKNVAYQGLSGHG